jgi:hypothetical protein
MGNITGLYVCPTCNRGVSFAQAANNIAICTCGEVWQRDGEKLDSRMIPIIEHPDDYIQPGTEGSWNNKTFIVTGRFRAWFEETAFNYWSIDMGDDRAWYLGTGYGLYAIYELLPGVTLDHHALTLLKSSRHILLDNNASYELTRQNKCNYLDIEGSFHKPGIGHRVSTYEAASGNTKIEIFEYAPDGSEVYITHPVIFADLQLKHVREREPSGHTFSCLQCKKQHTVKTYPYSQSWVCPDCGARYCLVNSCQSKHSGKNTGQTPHMDIGLGTLLSFNEIPYTVIGFVWKQDTHDEQETWKEYTLYHKIHGYAFLTESEGHWMLLKEAIETPSLEDSRKQSFFYKDKEFELFLKYGFKILYAQGEFPGNIFNDTYAVKATDFISQPDIWCVEENSKEGLTWFYGQYIDKDIIAQQVDIKLPASRGIAPAQEKIKADTATIIRATLIVLVLVLLVQYFTDMTNSNKQIMDARFSLADSVVTQTFATEKFELKKWKSNLEFRIYAPVDNSWFELSATLVNVKTGEEFSLEQGVEYYHGYSDGESWSEGSYNETAYLSSIPAGTYFLQLSSSREMGLPESNVIRSFDVRITNDNPMYRNFWIIIALLLAWPVIMIILNNYYEKKRWQASPYSKFTYDN